MQGSPFPATMLPIGATSRPLAIISLLVVPPRLDRQQRQPDIRPSVLASRKATSWSGHRELQACPPATQTAPYLWLRTTAVRTGVVLLTETLEVVMKFLD